MWLSYLTMVLLMLVGILLIIVVLLQRGRGGGLAGALGGMGGQSAFGTKAGDVFTRITIVIAMIWVVLAGVSGFALRADANRLAEQVAGQFAPEDEDEPPLDEAAEEPGIGAETKSPAEPATQTAEPKKAAETPAEQDEAATKAPTVEPDTPESEQKKQ